MYKIARKRKCREFKTTNLRERKKEMLDANFLPSQQGGGIRPINFPSLDDHFLYCDY